MGKLFAGPPANPRPSTPRPQAASVQPWEPPPGQLGALALMSQDVPLHSSFVPRQNGKLCPGLYLAEMQHLGETQPTLGKCASYEK